MTGKSDLRTIKDLIFHGNQDPDHTAIESPGYQPLTYRELRNQVLFGVKSLNAMGFSRNDRIAVMMKGGPETAVVSLAVMAGFTSAPLNPAYKTKEFETYFSKLGINGIIVEKDCETAATAVADSFNIPVIEVTPKKNKAGIFSFSPTSTRAAGEAVFAAPSDIAMLLQTSGTTSLPKIVPNSQQQLCRRAEMLCTAFKWDKTDRSIHIVPFYHALGILGSFLAPLMAGGTVVCPKDFVASDFADLLKTYRLTHYSAGPALHQHILREIKKVPPVELKTHSLRFIRSTSAFLPENVREELEKVLGVPVIESYGMSEAGLVTVNFPPKPGSVGTPIVESLRILDENGKDLMPFENGEIVIKGTTVFSGYENAPDENNAAFADGGFRTGDIGYLDNEGYLYLTGRKKELINKGGEKISPAEIDQVLLSHPAVQQAMAFRINDTALGEDIAAMVVLNNYTPEEELKKYLLDRIIPFKVPRRIFVVDEIPLGQTGKLQRYRGTEYYHTSISEEVKNPGLSIDSVSPVLSLNHEILVQLWKEVLEIPSISTDDDFFKSGGNSLAAIELLIKIQRTFHLALLPDTIYVFPTIRQQAAMIAEKTGHGKHYHPLIIPIRAHGVLPPLICIHSVGGWIGTYQNIFRFFNQDRPVFGIRARGLEPGEKPFETIKEAVREYADAIKSVQKEGPYRLLGYSAGALYAFELACQLQERGESVIYLGNIDQSAPRQRSEGTVHHMVPGKKGTGAIMGTGYRMYHFLNNRLKNRKEMLPTFFKKGIRAFHNRMVHLSGTPPYQDWILTYPERQQPLLRTIKKALRNYQPRTFSGNLILFSTGQDTSSYPGDVTRGWSAFVTGQTTILDIPGDHGNLYLDPYAYEVAQKIEESLTEC